MSSNNAQISSNTIFMLIILLLSIVLIIVLLNTWQGSFEDQSEIDLPTFANSDVPEFQSEEEMKLSNNILEVISP